MSADTSIEGIETWTLSDMSHIAVRPGGQTFWVHRVPRGWEAVAVQPWDGDLNAKIVAMAGDAIDESLADVPSEVFRWLVQNR